MEIPKKLRAHGGTYDGREAAMGPAQKFSFIGPGDGDYIWDGTLDEDGAAHFAPFVKEPDR